MWLVWLDAEECCRSLKRVWHHLVNNASSNLPSPSEIQWTAYIMTRQPHVSSLDSSS